MAKFFGMFPDVKGLTEQFNAKFDELKTILIEMRDILAQIRDQKASQ